VRFFFVSKMRRDKKKKGKTLYKKKLQQQKSKTEAEKSEPRKRYFPSFLPLLRRLERRAAEKGLSKRREGKEGVQIWLLSHARAGCDGGIKVGRMEKKTQKFEVKDNDSNGCCWYQKEKDGQTALSLSPDTRAVARGPLPLGEEKSGEKRGLSSMIVVVAVLWGGEKTQHQNSQRNLKRRKLFCFVSSNRHA